MPLRSPEDAFNFATNHRVQTTKGWLETSAMIARSANRTELKQNSVARDAMTNEHMELSEKRVWLKDKPREWADVAAEASITDSKVHVGTVFGICVEKRSELDISDPERQFKGRYVVQGNRVKDEYSETALFNKLGSSPASMEASKAVDAYGLLLGHLIQQADAQQAYTQAMLGDTIPGIKSHTPCQVSVNTWVRPPPECRTPAMAKMKDPVVPLIRALYGYPDAGGGGGGTGNATATITSVPSDSAHRTRIGHPPTSTLVSSYSSWFTSTTSRWAPPLQGGHGRRLETRQVGHHHGRPYCRRKMPRMLAHCLRPRNQRAHGPCDGIRHVCLYEAMCYSLQGSCRKPTMELKKVDTPFIQAMDGEGGDAPHPLAERGGGQKACWRRLHPPSS